jgi:hypothetical protein
MPPVERGRYNVVIGVAMRRRLTESSIPAWHVFNSFRLMARQSAGFLRRMNREGFGVGERRG